MTKLTKNTTTVKIFIIIKYATLQHNINMGMRLRNLYKRVRIIMPWVEWMSLSPLFFIIINNNIVVVCLLSLLLNGLLYYKFMDEKPSKKSNEAGKIYKCIKQGFFGVRIKKWNEHFLVGLFYFVFESSHKKCKKLI